MQISAVKKPILQQVSKTASDEPDSASMSGRASSEHTDLQPTASNFAQKDNGNQLDWLGKQAEKNFHAGQSLLSQEQQISREFKQQFSELANNPDKFSRLMKQVFGDNFDIAQAEAFRTAALNNNFDWLPDVEFVSAENMNGGMAAFSSESNTIYINEDIRGTALAQQYYTEEVGHFLDNEINSSDTIGDEGELFQLRLSGQQLSASDIESLATENDHGTIVVNGEQQEVEFGLLGNIINTVTAPIREHIIEPIRDNIIAPIKEQVIEPITNVIIKPVRDIVKGYIGALTDSAGYLLSGVKDVLDGHVFKGIKKILYSPFNTAQNFIGATYDGLVVALERLFHVIDKLFNFGEQRGLTPAETARLNLVFGGSIDPGEITIHRGGTYDSLFNPDEGLTIRNEIYIPNTNSRGEPHYHPNGELNELGLQLLVHEAVHVWQYSNEGLGYINNSSTSQINEDWFGSKDPYQWEDAVVAGIAFEDMGIEQQAHLIEDIAVFLANGSFAAGSFSINGVVLTDPSPEWTIIQNARNAVLG